MNTKTPITSIQIDQYIPSDFEENILEIIGLLQNGNPSKIVSAKSIALSIYGEEYKQYDLIMIFNSIRKLIHKKLLKKVEFKTITKDCRVGYVLDGNGIKKIFLHKM